MSGWNRSAAAEADKMDDEDWRTARAPHHKPVYPNLFVDKLANRARSYQRLEKISGPAEYCSALGAKGLYGEA